MRDRQTRGPEFAVPHESDGIRTHPKHPNYMGRWPTPESEVVFTVNSDQVEKGLLCVAIVIQYLGSRCQSGCLVAQPRNSTYNSA